jgi:hypothetical protein
VQPRSATTNWTAIFLLFPSFDYFSSLQCRTDFQLVLAYFDLFWPLWNDGVVLLAENVVPKSLDWTDWEPTGPTGSESPTKYYKTVGWYDELTTPTDIGTTNSKIRSTSR